MTHSEIAGVGEVRNLNRETSLVDTSDRQFVFAGNSRAVVHESLYIFCFVRQLLS